MLSTSRLRLYKSRFGWGFIASSCVLTISTILLTKEPKPLATPQVRPPLTGNSTIHEERGTKPDLPVGGESKVPPASERSVESPPNPTRTSTDLTLFMSAASLLTSTATFAGFFFTTLLSWRRERREQRSFDVDIKKKELEVEKLRRDLEKTVNASDGDSR